MLTRIAFAFVVATLAIALMFSIFGLYMTAPWWVSAWAGLFFVAIIFWMIKTY